MHYIWCAFFNAEERIGHHLKPFCQRSGPVDRIANKYRK